MTIQFYMRGYNTSAPGAVGYVDWVVDDTPDSSATYVPAPYNPAHIQNITVNRVVQSPVNNYLKSIQPSIVNNAYNNPQDPYLFHLNSYDWLNPTANGITGPITVPPFSQPIGISVVRGSASVSEPFTPTNYASLFWEENAGGSWYFAYINSNGSIGSPLAVSMGPLTVNGFELVDGYLAVTDNLSDQWALSGLIRIPDNQFIKARNSFNNADANVIGLDNFTASTPFGQTNRVQVGDINFSVHVPSYLTVDGYIYDGSPGLAAQSGFIRLPNNVVGITSRNAGATGDLNLLSTDNLNHILHGVAGLNAGQIFNTSPGSEYYFEVNTTNGIHIGTNYVSFDSTDSTPLINQLTTGGAGGQALTLQAQNATTNGGILNLTSGTGSSAANAGNVNLQTGGVTREIVTPTGMILLTPTYAFGGSADAVTVVNPTFKQDSIAQSGSQTTPLTVQAANNTGSGAGTIGSNLVLTSGTASNLGNNNAGNVLIEVGGVTPAAIAISPGTPFPTVLMTANLTVMGTTTTIDTTVIDVEGRVIHGNWTTGTAPPPTAPNAANSMTGYAIHRGNPNFGITPDRDSAALIYNETTDIYTDGYWKLTGILNDIDTVASTTGLTHTLPLLASAVVATANPVQEFTAKTQIPSAGGFRSLNNTIAVSSRNAASTQDLRLIGTDAANHIILGETPGPINAGMQFYTTTGNLYDFFVNNVSEVQISSDGNGPFIRESATTFVPALTGFVRVPNAATAVSARNAGNSADIMMLASDAANHIVMGNPTTPTNAGFIFNTTTGSLFDYWTNSVSEVQLGSDVNGPFVRESASSFVPAVSGFVRVPANITAVAARNAGNNGDILLLGTDNLNHILHGDSVAPTNGGHIFSTTTSSVFDFWVNGISQVSIGANEINFTNTDGYSTIQQSPSYLSNVTGASLSILAQSVFGAGGVGGNLVLSSGFGGLIDGYIDLQVSGITVAAVEPNKFTFVQGKRRHVTQITGTYNVSLTDDYIAITALTSPFSIFLPAFGTPAGPYIGDEYEIKDTTGNAGTFTVTVNGNGANIDGSSTFVFTQPYAAAKFTFTGTAWSAS